MTLIRKLIQGALVFPVLGLVLAGIGYLGPVPASLRADTMTSTILPRSAAASLADRAVLERAYNPAVGSQQADGLLELEPNLKPDEMRAVRRALDAAAYKGSGATKRTVSVVQPEGTAGKIRALFAILPMILLGFGIVSSARMRLDPDNHRIMMAEVARLDAGGSKTDAPTEAIRVCEVLSGMKYDKLRSGS
ncbi:hypothetical protein MASR2M48_22170 [Spirochaetota bacterium]